MKEMFKRNRTTIALVMIFLLGLALLLYPTISNYWNSLHQSHAIAKFAQEVAEVDSIDYEELWKKAEAYNATLAEHENRWMLSEEELETYSEQLYISTLGIIGYIEIPKIKVSLPIYRGTDEAMLQVGIGHLEGSSVPVGGPSTHSVLSGHRGLPSAKLFSNLDELLAGDEFILQILDETLTYEVDRIRIVEPDDYSALEIKEGQDLCTLLTCTPYGVNSHRLLVRGHRVENKVKNTVRVTADAIQIEPILIAPIVAAPILLLLLIWLLVYYRRR